MVNRAATLAVSALALLVVSEAVSNTSSRRIAPGMTPSLRNQLGLAVAELMFGSAPRGASRAKAAAIPSRLTVRFECDTQSANRFDSLSSIGRDSIKRWNQLLDASVFVETDGDAQVVISFQKQVRYQGSLVAGLNTWTRRVADGGDLQVLASIEISTNGPSGTALTTGQIRKTTMHELGHLVGLDDHHSSRHLMGPLSSDPTGESLPPSVESLVEFNRLVQEIVVAVPVTPASRVPKIFRLKERD